MLKGLVSWLPWVLAVGVMYFLSRLKAQMLQLNLFIVLMLLMSVTIAFWFWLAGSGDKGK